MFLFFGVSKFYFESGTKSAVGVGRDALFCIFWFEQSEITLTWFFLILEICFSSTEILFSKSSISPLLTEAADVTVMLPFILIMTSSPLPTGLCGGRKSRMSSHLLMSIEPRGARPSCWRPLTLAKLPEPACVEGVTPDYSYYIIDRSVFCSVNLFCKIKF